MTIVEFLQARYDDEHARLDELDDIQSYPQAVYWTSRRNMAEGVGPCVAAEMVAGPKWFVRFYPSQPRSAPDWGWVVNEKARELFSQDDVQRRLREVEAKRRILDAHMRDSHWCPMGDEIFRALALPYADHPDYDPSWSPR